VHRLADQVRGALAGDRPSGGEDDAVEVPAAVRRDPGHLHVALDPTPDGVRVTVAGQDRPGVMAAVAGALALLRTSVRSARLTTHGGVAVSVWDVVEQRADVAVLAQRVGAVLAGVLDPAQRLRLPPPALPPAVVVHPDASTRSTVLEVRTEDRPGVVWAVCDALTRLGLDVRSAHVATVGPQAHDVFYVRQPEGGRLGQDQAATAVHAVRRALGAAVTLDA
jgi:[protein-PII] uridylyltransferase